MLLQVEAGPFSKIAGAVLLAIYFIPAILGRKKRQSTAILVLNLLLGWTVLGWIGALVWALSKDAPTVAPVAAAPSAPAGPSRPSVADELGKLRQLRDAGELSNEEFLNQRARLLRS